MRQALRVPCRILPRVVLLAFGLVVLLALTSNAQNIAQVQKKGVDTNMVLSVAFSADGTMVAGGGFDKAIKIWDPETGKLRCILLGHTKTIRDVAFSPDSKTLAALGDDQKLRLYDAKTTAMKWESRKLDGQPFSLAFSPDGTTLAITTGKTLEAGRHWSGEVKFLGAQTGTVKRSRMIDEGKASSIAFSPDGRTVATAEGVVKLWDARTDKLLRTLAPDRGAVRRVVFASDGKSLAGAGGYSMAVGEGTQLVSEAHIWDYRTGKLRHTLSEMNPGLRSVAFSPDGKILATGSRGPIRRMRNRTWVTSEMKLWDAHTGTLLRTVEGPLGEVWSIAFSPDGATIVLCDDERMALIDAQTGEEKRTLMTSGR